MLAAACGWGTPAFAQPAWWLTLGAQLAFDTGRLSDARDKEAGALLGAGVPVLHLGSVLLALEAEGSASRVKQRFGTKLEAREDTIDIWRGRLGLRASWSEEDEEPLLVPYARGGGVYEADRLTHANDDGIGWYAGVGLDLRLGEHWALGPSVTYEEVSMRERTRTLLLGIGLTFSY